MAYLGNDLQVAFPTYRNIDDISGSFNGVTTSFPLTVAGVAPIPAPINSQQCLISVNGVVQRPDDSGTEGFRLSGGNIIFASAPAGGVDFFGVILAGADYVNIGANFPSGTAVAPSITFDSDLDTGIYNPAGNQIGFTTSGVQRLVINSSGQISGGLGTAAAPVISFISDPNTGIYSPGADQVAISTNSTGHLFVDSSGNVKLGAAAASGFRLSNDGDVWLGNGYGVEIGRLFNDSGTLCLRASSNVTGLGLATNSSSSHAVRITSAGLVGVGTSSPSQRLTVAGNIVTTSAAGTDSYINASTAGVQNTYLGFNNSGSTNSNGVLNNYSYVGNGNAYGLQLLTNGGPAVTINTLQQVGVGTTSPGYLLDVAGSARIKTGATGTPFVVSTGGDSQGSLRFGSSSFFYGIYGGPDYLSLQFHTGGSESLRIDSLGRVGIGTSTPQASADIRGTASASAEIVRVGNGTKYIGIGTEGTNYSWIQSFASASLCLNPLGNNVGIGTTSPRFLVSLGSISATGSSTPDTIDLGGTFSSTAGANPKLRLYWDGSQSYGFGVSSGQLDYMVAGAAAHVWHINNSERCRIDSSGRLLVGTSTARSNFFNSNITAACQIEGTGSTSSASRGSISIVNNNTDANQTSYLILGKSNGSGLGSNTIVTSDTYLGIISFQGADGSEFVDGASIHAQVDGTPGANDLPTRLVFSTTADGASSPTERMRIKAGGEVIINATALAIDSTSKFYVSGTSEYVAPSGSWVQYISTAGTGNQNLVQFSRSNGSVEVGKITTDGTSTTYGTTSDYRLKQNITPVTESIARLKQLKPCQFSFTSNPDKIVDGFIAHEVQLVVPEAVTGTKDEVDVDNNPIYQAIDQSKLVPLLAAALQEAVAKIESLEARLTAAGI